MRVCPDAGRGDACKWSGARAAIDATVTASDCLARAVQVLQSCRILGMDAVAGPATSHDTCEFAIVGVHEAVAVLRCGALLLQSTAER